MNKMVSISLDLLVVASMFCAFALNTVAADENNIDKLRKW